MSDVASIMFVVDRDICVCEPLQPLIPGKGCQSEPFASAQEFLDYPLINFSNCPGFDVFLNDPDIESLVTDERRFLRRRRTA